MKLRDLKIETQLKIGFSFLLFLVIILGAASYIQTEKLHSQTKTMYEHPIKVRFAIGELTRNLMFMRMGIRDLLLIEDEVIRQNVMNDLAESQLNVEKEIGVLRKWYLGPKSDIENLTAEFTKWVSIRAESIRLLSEGKTEEAKVRHAPGGIAPKQALNVLGSLDKISIFAMNKSNELYNNSKILRDSQNRQLIFLIAFILLFSLVISYVLLRNIHKPLKILTNATKSFKDGDMTARSSYKLKNEFGDLSDSFNSLAETIRSNTQRLTVLVEERTKELRESEEKLTENLNLLKNAGITAKFGGWNVILNENRSYWSDEVSAIHEMPAGYCPLVQDGINFYAPEWREKITQVFTDCAQKGIPYDEEMEILTSTGKRVWIRTTGEAVKDDNGNIFKVQGGFQDITERKQAEEHLKNKMNELKQMNELMIDREIKMVELKKEINELLKASGKPEKY